MTDKFHHLISVIQPPLSQRCNGHQHLFLLGQVRSAQGKTEEAKRLFLKAHEINPKKFPKP